MSGDATRPFEVTGDTFTDFASAAGRSCDNQKNSCAEMANNGTATFTVADCENQNSEYYLSPLCWERDARFSDCAGCSPVPLGHHY